MANHGSYTAHASRQLEIHHGKSTQSFHLSVNMPYPGIVIVLEEPVDGLRKG